MTMTTGILLAAGRGSRMGCTKQLLPWPVPDGPGTVIEASFDLIAPHCNRVIVVLDHDRTEILNTLNNRSFEIVSGNKDSELIESIKVAIRHAITFELPERFLLHPADYPGVSQSTIEELLSYSEVNNEKVLIPTFDGKGGHPVVIPSKFASDILSFSGNCGLRDYWKEIKESVYRLKVSDSGVVNDLDTQEDYHSGTA